jgi:hypothetical protein
LNHSGSVLRPSWLRPWTLYCSILQGRIQKRTRVEEKWGCLKCFNQENLKINEILQKRN